VSACLFLARVTAERALLRSPLAAKVTAIMDAPITRSEGLVL
jgi:hypothetical protein